MTDRNERLKSIRELVHDHWFCDNPNCSDVEDEILFLLALVERYEKALHTVGDRRLHLDGDACAFIAREALEEGERE